MTPSYEVKTLFDQGSAKYAEDKFINSAPFFGVLDGFSEPYLTNVGPKMIDGSSSGAALVESVAKALLSALPHEGLLEVLKKANSAVSQTALQRGLDINSADQLPGTAFAFAKLGDEKIEIVQGGDCFAVWLKGNGEMGATANQNYLLEKKQLGVLQTVLKKYQGDREAAWQEYLPSVVQARREHTNAPIKEQYVALNGQPASEQFWNSFSVHRKGIDLLLLFTDGLVKFDESEQPEQIARNAIELYKKGGLSALLENTRTLEARQDEQLRHTRAAEAAAVAIEFKNI